MILNTEALIITNKDVPIKRREISDKLFFSGAGIDIYILLTLIILTNMSLLHGGVNSSLVFLPSAVKAGEWWRTLTYPFVHVSWYHLLLDAGAFFLLYSELKSKKISEKIFYLVMCGTVSLFAALIASPMIYARGLCGLSGIAHGLMAVSALDMMRQEKNYRTGLILFLLVVPKSIFETISGDVVFSFMHMGLCGIPLAACHAGGVLGGIIAHCIVRIKNRKHHDNKICAD